jgi:hypothetical protein
LDKRIMGAVGIAMFVVGMLTIVWGGAIIKSSMLGVVGAVTALVGVIILNMRVE